MARNGFIFDGTSTFICVIPFLLVSVQLAATDSDKRIKNEATNAKGTSASLKDPKHSADSSGARNYNIDNDRSGHYGRGSSNFGNESESPALNTFLENVLKAQNELKWIDQAARRANHDYRLSSSSSRPAPGRYLATSLHRHGLSLESDIEHPTRFRGKRGFDENSETAWLAQKRKYANGSTGVTPEREYSEKEMAYKRKADWDDFDDIDRYRFRLNRPVYEKGTMDDQPLKDWTSGEGSPRSSSYSLNPNRDLEPGRDNRLNRWSPDYAAAHKSGTVDQPRSHDEHYSDSYPKSNGRDEREIQRSDANLLNHVGKSTFKGTKQEETSLSLGSLEKMVLDLKQSLKGGERKIAEKTPGFSFRGNYPTHDHQNSNDARNKQVNRYAPGNTDKKSNWWNDPRPAEEIFDFKRHAADPVDRDVENVERDERRRKRAEHRNDQNEEDPNVFYRAGFGTSYHEKQNSANAVGRKRRSNVGTLGQEHPEYITLIASQAIIDRAKPSSNATPKIEEPRVDLEDVIDAKTAKRIAETDSSRATNAYTAGKGSSPSESGETGDTNMPEIYGMSAANGPADFHVGSSENGTAKNYPKNEKNERDMGERSSAQPRGHSDSSAYNSSIDRSRTKLEDNSPQSSELATENESSMNTVAGEGRLRGAGNGTSKGERKKEANVEPIQREEVIKVFEPQGRLHQDSAGTKGIEETDANDHDDERRKLSQQVSREEGINVDAGLPAADVTIMKDSLVKNAERSCGNGSAPAKGEKSMRKFDMEKRVLTQENQPNKVVATSVDVSVHEIQINPPERTQEEEAEKMRIRDQSKLVNGTSLDDFVKNTVSVDSQDEKQPIMQEKEMSVQDPMLNGLQNSDKTLNVDDSDEFFKGLSKLAKNLMAKNNNEEQSGLIKMDSDLIPPNVRGPLQNWQGGKEQKSTENRREFRERNLVHVPETESGRNIDRSGTEHSIDTGFAAPDKNSFNFVEITSPNDKAIMEVITGSDRGGSNEKVGKQFSEALGNPINNRQNRYVNERDGKYTSAGGLSSSRYDVSNRDEGKMIESDYVRSFDTRMDKHSGVDDENWKRNERTTRKLLWASVPSLDPIGSDAEGRNDAKKYANGNIEGVGNYVEEEEEKAIDDESGHELHLPADREVRSSKTEASNALKAKVDMLIKQRMNSKDGTNRDYVRKRRYPMGTIEYYDYDSEIDGQEEKASAISSEQNQDNLDKGSAQSPIKADGEKSLAGSGGNETCKSGTLAGVKKNEHAEQAMKEERERAKLKNKVPKEEFIADLGQARHPNSTGKTQKPPSFSGTRSEYEREKISGAKEGPQMIFQGEDAPGDIYRGRSQVDVKSILDRTVESELRSLRDSSKTAENGEREVLLDEPLEYVLSVHNSLEPVEVGDFLEDAHPISLLKSSKELDSSSDLYDDYEAPSYGDQYYQDIDDQRKNIRPLYEELKKVYDWSEGVRDRPRYRGDLRMRFETDDKAERESTAVAPVQQDRNSSNTSKSNYLALKSTDDLFKSGIEQSNPSDDRKMDGQKTTVWKVMKVEPTDNSHVKMATPAQSFVRQKTYPETDSLSPYANPKYIESIRSADNSPNVGHGKQLGLDSKDLHESFVDPVDWTDDLDGDVRVRLGRSLMTIENSANRFARKMEDKQWPVDDVNENSLWDIEGIENDLSAYLPESSLAKIRVKRQSIDGDLKQSAANKYPRNRRTDVEEGIRLNQVQEKNANAERDLVRGTVERDMPSFEDAIEASLKNANKHENLNVEIVKDVIGKEIASEKTRDITNFAEEGDSNSAQRSNLENVLNDDTLRLKRGAVNYRTFYDDVNDGWRETGEGQGYNRYSANKMDTDDHPRESDLYGQLDNQHFDGYFVPQWREEPLYNNSTEEFNQDNYVKMIRSVPSKKGKSKKQRSSKIAQKHTGNTHKKNRERHHKRSSHDSEENVEDADWKLDEDDEIMDPFSSETDKLFKKPESASYKNYVETPRKTRKSEDNSRQGRLKTLLAVDNMEDESQMNLALHGELAGKIVEKIFDQVKSNEALKVTLGPGLYRKHKPEDEAIGHNSFRKGADHDEVKHTEAMMRRVMELLGRLVLDEVQRKTCASLPADMKDFLHWILGVDKGQGAREQTPPLPHVRHEQTPEQYPDNKFLFHGATNNELDSELSELYDKVRVLKDLVKEYNTLPEDEKAKVQTVYDYLERQINLLLEYIRSKEMNETEAKDMTSIAGARSRTGNILQYQSLVPNVTDGSNATILNNFAPVANIPGIFNLNDTTLNMDYQNPLDETKESDQAKYRKVRSSDAERKRKKHKKRRRKHRKHRKHKDDLGRSKYHDAIHDVGGFRRKRANLKENEWNPFESRGDKREFVSKETDVLRDNNNVSALYWENVLARNRESGKSGTVDVHMSAPKEYYSLRGLKTGDIEPNSDTGKNRLQDSSHEKYQDILPIKGKDPIDDEVLLLTKREAWKRENERQLEEVAFGKDMRSNPKVEEQFRRLTEIDKRKNVGGENTREKRENVAMSAEHAFDDENDTSSNDPTAGTMTNNARGRNEANQSNETGVEKVSDSLAKTGVTLFELPSDNATCKRCTWSKENHEDNGSSDDDRRLKRLEQKINVYPDRIDDASMTKDTTPRKENIHPDNEHDGTIAVNQQTLVP